nr:synaptic ras gtpase activating protein syngap [Hymenolepis microstoma]
MLFCHRGSKASTPPSPSQKPHEPSTPCYRNSQINNVDAEEWNLPSILTAGSLDELTASNSLLPQAPVMPPILEAQLETLSSREANIKTNGSIDRSSSNRRSQQMLSSASMHSLVSSATSQDYNRGLGSKKGGSASILSNVVDGNLSLPITHKKHPHYSGRSLLSLSHHRSGSNTLRKLRSLDVQQFSSLLDFEERYNDPWVGSITLRRTVKPNLENERHRENSLFLSILEAKGLHNKRRYYCDVCLDRTLYARTTSKQSTSNSIFWAEEFDLNNLPDVSILTVSLYLEADGGKDGRKGLLTRSNNKKSSKKPQNRLVGFVTLPVTNLCARNPSQTWLTLQPPGNADSMNPMLISSNEIGGGNFTIGSNNSTGFISTTSSDNAPHGTGVQLRVSVRYKSVVILPISVYIPLHTLVQENGIEMTEWFEHLIPLKLKEEVASCLVNLHERGGTATAFLTELVVREVSDLENESMTFRSNTMATKAVESYIKLVGKEYLHNLLYRYIQRVLTCPDTWEVDPSKLSHSNLSGGSLLSSDGRGTSSTATMIIQDYCSRKRVSSTNSSYSDAPENGLSRLAVLNNGRVAQPGSLVYSQTQLLQHLDLVWEAVCASLPNFPKSLLDVFSSFRAALEPSKGAEFCDKLISACIFLRFVCPAILTPSLFGLASTFPGESNCQRNLTLIAKSLQSLANLSTFGDKESFMRFMNAYVEVQIPVMRKFLRDISSLPGVLENSSVEHITSPVASTIDCGYELACLQNICQELINPPGGQRNASTTSSVFPSENTPSTEFLPPSLSHLPEIIENLENLKNGTGLPSSDFIESRVTTDSAYASVDSTKRLPAPPMAYATSSSVKSAILNPQSPMEEFKVDFSSSTVPQQSIPDLNTIGSPITKPRAVRPTTVRLPGSGGYQHQSSLSDVVMTSSKGTTPFGDDEADDRVTVRELLNASVFRQNSGAGRQDVDYDDPYTDEVYDSTHTSRRRTIYDAPYEGENKSCGSGGQMTSSSGASPVHTLQFPSPPHSAFSLYRRPVVPNSPGSELQQVECFTSSPSVAPPAPPQIKTLTISRSSSGIASAEQFSPRRNHQHHRNHHHHAAVARGPLKATTTTLSNSENIILEPRPNSIITHFKPHLSRSSTASSSLINNNKQESPTTATQHHYPYRQVINNISLASNHPPPSTATSLIGTPIQSTTLQQNMSSSAVGASLIPMDYDLGDYYAGSVVTDDMAAIGINSNSWYLEPDSSSRRQLSFKKYSEQSKTKGYSQTQPVLAENEQILTSTLEELGDAVAWLERERNDLLNMQERHLSNNRSRSRPTQSPNYTPLTLPSKCSPSLTIPAPAVFEISPTASKTTQLRLHPHTSTPSLHRVHYNPDEPSVLTQSTNSLIEPIHPQHKAHRSAVSKTFTLTRSGSASVSPRRSREGSESSDTHPSAPVWRPRTTTLVLSKPSAPGVATTVVGINGALHRSSPQTPVGIRRSSNRNDGSDELEYVVRHPHRPRPHPPSYVSTSNCNIFTPKNPSRNQSPSQSSTTRRGAGDDGGGGGGGVYILSSSPLIS